MTASVTTAMPAKVETPFRRLLSEFMEDKLAVIGAVVMRGGLGGIIFAHLASRSIAARRSATSRFPLFPTAWVWRSPHRCLSPNGCTTSAR